MKVFKFGGASIKDAASIRNVLKVLEITDQQQLVIVFSAIGKTTNALEALIAPMRHNEPFDSEVYLEITKSHHQIISELFEGDAQHISTEIQEILDQIKNDLEKYKEKDYNFLYDQIISYGELLSTTILSEFLTNRGIKNTLVSAKELIKTDHSYRAAKVQWTQTKKEIEKHISKDAVSITQGFIGQNSEGYTTTLGREGSDYTAAILGAALQVESVTIWKDVPGVLNADPRVFKDAELLSQVSYREAIELAYYGASVIHPKTLQPLLNQEIPLHVRSFINPEATGTLVCKGPNILPVLPCFIVKSELSLLTFTTLNYSFLNEQMIGEIFLQLQKYRVKVHMIQNTAIELKLCVTNQFYELNKVLETFRANYKVNSQENVKLYTIRHYDQQSIQRITKGKSVLLKQKTVETYRIVVLEK